MVCQLENSLERNSELRVLVERRLQGGGGLSPSDFSPDPGQSVRHDDRRLQQIETELMRLIAENETLKSQQQTTERLLDVARHSNARSVADSGVKSKFIFGANCGGSQDPE